MSSGWQNVNFLKITHLFSLSTVMLSSVALSGFSVSFLLKISRGRRFLRVTVSVFLFASR